MRGEGERPIGRVMAFSAVTAGVCLRLAVKQYFHHGVLAVVVRGQQEGREEALLRVVHEHVQVLLNVRLLRGQGLPLRLDVLDPPHGRPHHPNLLLQRRKGIERRDGRDEGRRDRHPLLLLHQRQDCPDGTNGIRKNLEGKQGPSQRVSQLFQLFRLLLPSMLQVLMAVENPTFFLSRKPFHLFIRPVNFHAHCHFLANDAKEPNPKSRTAENGNVVIPSPTESESMFIGLRRRYFPLVTCTSEAP
mmetsp:Transcript_26950/g.70915  ORF Transcript_26950/g.70915 Transcript_26950/m.70915 type:complete len:246 (-) Transcript_26950:2117-2854(-)